jgi:AraC-like DNA-binding protein
LNDLYAIVQIIIVSVQIPMGSLVPVPDPLSDVLALLKPRSLVSAGIDAGGNWSIQFPAQPGLRFQAVISGRCWLRVEGVSEAVRLEPGDCFLLAKGNRFCIASDLALPPADAYEVLAHKRDGVATINKGGDFLGVGCFFTVAARHADELLRELPPIAHISGAAEQTVLRWSLERMLVEQREPHPGSFLVTQHLAHMMLIQVLRHHLAEGSKVAAGWLFALADPRMSAALTAIHAEPGYRWTLQLLAKRAGMSRTSFALRFKAMVGVSAMEYLTRWRMLRAGDRLENNSEPVSAIALSLGYESESAFAVAFKRAMGCSPRQYSRYQRASSPDAALHPRVDEIDRWLGQIETLDD